MLKNLLYLTLILSITLSFAFVGDIFPQHKNGFFIELSGLGYSWKNSELNTNPISDLLGYYNILYRNYFGKNILSQLSISYLNLNQLLSYMGETSTEVSVGIWSSEIFNHSNLYFKNLSLKYHLSIGSMGIHYVSKNTESATNFDVYGLYTKDFVQLGFYLDNNKEVFTNIEVGKIFKIASNPENLDPEYQTYINEIENKSLYALIRGGLKWYFNPYSIFEIGYRIPLIKSPFSAIQGFGPLNYIYNYNQIINEDSQLINVPWITTNYYINFSMAF